MDEATLRELIAGGETATVEFKSSAARPADIAVRMCGMANNRAGGVIIFGIDDATREPVGIRNASLTHDVVLRASRMIKPPVVLDESAVAIWTLDGVTLLSVEVPSNTGTLFQYDGACYVRRGTTTVPLSVDEISAHLNAFVPSRWETQPVPAATLNDINQRELDDFLKVRLQAGHLPDRAGSPADLLRGLGAAVEDGQVGAAVPTNTGLLMFGRSPQRFLPHSEVVCVKYADTQGIRAYIDRKNYTGTVPDLIDQTSRFLQQYIRVGATIRGFYREDEPEYPYEALREAVVNAIVHRDYSRVGEAVRVFMYSDRVEVRSPGALVAGIALDDLTSLRVPSRPRNPVLAGLLRDLPGYMERLGSGIRFMVREMEALGLPRPEFTDHYDFIVTFRNGQSSDRDEVLSDRQNKALEMVRVKGSISTREYCAVTGVSARTGLRDLLELAELGLLVARGSRRAKRFHLP